MLETALNSINISGNIGHSLVLFNDKWHQGVIGIIASRIKEKYFRPTLVFARDESGFLKGSGRSIPSLHLRDALDLVSKKYPKIIMTSGGHAMAAGLTIKEEDFTKFSEVFDQTSQELLSESDLNISTEVDHSILDQDLTYKSVNLINKEILGQGFPSPLYSDEFEVISQKIIAEKHNKLLLRKNEKNYDAIYFNSDQNQPDTITAIYSIEVNDFNGVRAIQLIIKSAL